jgi:hypothetical protein
MESTVTPAPTPALASHPDLVEALAGVLRDSPEPLTVKDIRAALGQLWRRLALDHLTDVLHRQAAAQVFFVYPKYRSRHERFWDRPLRVHVELLLRGSLRAGPLPMVTLRQRLPGYAKSLADSVLEEQLAQGHMHRHPPGAGRKGARIGLEPPDARAYLRPELDRLFRRFQKLGFSKGELREALADLVRESEWTNEPRYQTTELAGIS